MTTNRTPIRAVTGVLVLIVSLTLIVLLGRDSDGDQVSADVVRVLADGFVDADEYSSAFARFLECVSDLGYSATSTTYVESTRQFHATDFEPRPQDAAEFELITAQCYEPELGAIEYAWLTQSDSGPQGSSIP